MAPRSRTLTLRAMAAAQRGRSARGKSCRRAKEEESLFRVPIIAGPFVLSAVESQVLAAGPTIRFLTGITVESDGNSAIASQFPTIGLAVCSTRLVGY